MVSLETEAMVKEAEANLKITEAIIEGKEKLLDAQAYLESQKKQEKNLFSDKFIKYLFNTKGWLRPIAQAVGVFIAFIFSCVDVIKTLIRPGITIYQGAMTTWFAYKAWLIMHSVQQPITADMASQIFMRIMDISIYLTVSCFTWWFADRNTAKFITSLYSKKNN